MIDSNRILYDMNYWYRLYKIVKILSPNLLMKIWHEKYAESKMDKIRMKDLIFIIRYSLALKIAEHFN